MITTHFCKCNGIGGLEVVNQLLAFHLVEGSHDGENIGKIVYDIIKDADAYCFQIYDCSGYATSRSMRCVILSCSELLLIFY